MKQSSKRNSRDAHWCCVDCGVNTFETDEYYMVHDAVWRSSGLAQDGGKLCVVCLEARLGRKLTQSDFTLARVNRCIGRYWRHSKRLADRIGEKSLSIVAS